MGFPGGSDGKEAARNARDLVLIPGQEDPMQKEMATHSSILVLGTTPLKYQFSSVQFSHSVVSDSLRPHEPQHARPSCPSPTPGVHSDSRLTNLISLLSMGLLCVLK